MKGIKIDFIFKYSLPMVVKFSLIMYYKKGWVLPLAHSGCLSVLSQVILCFLANDWTVSVHLIPSFFGRFLRLFLLSIIKLFYLPECSLFVLFCNTCFVRLFYFSVRIFSSAFSSSFCPRHFARKTIMRSFFFWIEGLVAFDVRKSPLRNESCQSKENREQWIFVVR